MTPNSESSNQTDEWGWPIQNPAPKKNVTFKKSGRSKPNVNHEQFYTSPAPSESSDIDELFKPMINSVEDFRSHHDPDDLYMALTAEIAEAKAKLEALIVRERLDEVMKPLRANKGPVETYGLLVDRMNELNSALRDAGGGKE